MSMCPRVAVSPCSRQLPSSRTLLPSLIACLVAWSACVAELSDEVPASANEEVEENKSDRAVRAGGAPIAVAATVQVHVPPSYLARSTDYAVKVNGVAVDVMSDVNGFDYVHFSMSGGTATIEVTASKLTSIAAHAVSPLKDSLIATISGNRLTYTISGDRYTIVSIQGIGEKLVVAADPLLTPPSPGSPHVFDVMSNPLVKNNRTNITNTTTGIQAAIDAASRYSGNSNQGRGIVYVPAGAYAVGNLTLRSDIELYLAPGAALFFASNLAGDQWNYTYRTDWTTKGNGTRWIVTESGASHIKIWGRGTLDGNAHNTGAFYNNILVLDNNHDVVIDGIVIKSGSKWGTMIGRSDAVTIVHVKFLQDLSGVGEDDALDIVESQDVTVSKTLAISFDDPFSVKTYDGNQDYIRFSGNHEEARNILIEQVIAWTGCHAFKIGQGTGQTTENVVFRDSVVFDAAHAVSLHHKAGPATVRNITWDQIDVQKISVSNLGRSWAYVNIESTATGPGKVEGITVKGIRVRDFGTDQSPLHGFDSTNNVNRISFRNIYVGPTGQGFYAQNATQAHLVRNAYVSNLQVSQNGVRRFSDGDAVKHEGAADWSFGNYKGNCGAGEAVTGMSQATGSPLVGPHALRCKSKGDAFADTVAAAHAVWTNADHYRSVATHAGYDWDVGYAKNECGDGEYVSGASQDPSSHALRHLRCAIGPVAGNGCNSKSVMTNDRGEDTGDWDPGYWKAECGPDTVVLGVSVDTSGKPHRILCCQ